MLIAAASQCLLLIIFLSLKEVSNKQAKGLLISLLAIVLAIIVSNAISSSYAYRELPVIAGFARGMVLLFGPLLYFYAMVTIKPSFALKPIHLLHLLPYLIAFAIIKIQASNVPNEIMIAAIDALMEGNVRMDGITTLWFVSYFLHLLVYIGYTRKMLKASVDNDSGEYAISTARRLSLLNRITFHFSLITILFLGISAYCLVTNSYTITGNFLYTLLLTALVFMLAYQAIGNYKLLVPGFIIKYRTGSISKQNKHDILAALTHLFEVEKIFTNPDLKVSVVAEQLQTSPHIISQVVNSQTGKNFSELLNDYRVQEFKKRAIQPDYTHYSIIAIAYDVGFNSKTAFNTTFKKHTGTTPSAYIKSLKKK